MLHTHTEISRETVLCSKLAVILILELLTSHSTTWNIHHPDTDVFLGRWGHVRIDANSAAFNLKFEQSIEFEWSGKKSCTQWSWRATVAIRFRDPSDNHDINIYIYSICMGLSSPCHNLPNFSLSTIFSWRRSTSMEKLLFSDSHWFTSTKKLTKLPKNMSMVPLCFGFRLVKLVATFQASISSSELSTKPHFPNSPIQVIQWGQTLPSGKLT